MTKENRHGFKDIDLRVCTRCGACVSVCPVGALESTGSDVRLRSGCIDCGLCYRFCSGREVDFAALSEAHLGAAPRDPLLGYYRQLAVSRARSKEIRGRAASGGVITGLLIHLLETNQIDGALGVTMDADQPWKCRAAILSTVEEVKEAAQSKYSVVTLDTLLRPARQQPGRFALVGLPCHVHGLRRLQRLGSYRTKFPFVLGLFCGFNLEPSATAHLIDKMGLAPEQIARLQYRGGPWPGGLVVDSRDGQQHVIPKDEYGYVNLTHVPRRCLVCADLTNELADLSVGDTWLEEYAGGWSTVISRSARGERLLQEAQQAGALTVEEISRDALLRSHGHLIAYKKEGYVVRQRWLRVPLEYTLLQPSVGLWRRIQQSLLLAAILVLSRAPVRRVIQRLPRSWLARMSRWGRTAARGGPRE